MKTNAIFKSGSLAMFVVCAGLLLVSSCGRHAALLNQAQDRYNKGVSALSPDNPQDTEAGRPDFEGSCALVDKAFENAPALEKDSLLFKAYMTKALCKWKLKLYQEAKASAAQALELARSGRSGMVKPRDKVLMEALPSFIVMEEVNDQLKRVRAETGTVNTNARQFFETSIFDPRPDKKGQLEEALDKLGRLRVQTREDKDLTREILQYELATLQVWSNGLSYLWENDTDGSQTTFVEEQRQFIEVEKNKRLQFIRELDGANG